MLRWRPDTEEEVRRRNIVAVLTKENESLKAEVETLSTQLDSTMLAMCDIYEAMLGGDK